MQVFTALVFDGIVRTGLTRVGSSRVELSQVGSGVSEEEGRKEVEMGSREELSSADAATTGSADRIM